MDKQTIIKVKHHDKPYVILDKRPLEDIRLSWKAKGLLAYLISKPDDWKVYLSELVQRSKDGADSTKSALKELRTCGYLEKYPIKDDKGRVVSWETCVYEVPHQDNEKEEPEGGFPYMWDSQQMDNRPLLKNDSTNNDLTKERNIYTVFQYWNSKKIIVHRTLTKKINGHISEKLNHYSVMEICQAINNYATVLFGDAYFFSYKWSLDEFLTRGNGFVKFTQENNPLDNYLKNQILNPQPIKQQSTKNPITEEQRRLYS